MNTRISPPPGDANEEVAALIETLHATGKRLEELTAGEVDTVADGEGRTFLLRGPQEQLRHIEAGKQAAILDALPAHIALLDTQGVIVSVNETWRKFPFVNAVHGPGHGIGLNYLEICDSARGEGSAGTHQIAAGIRSVLRSEVKSFSLEYPCHSPTERRWFLLTVTPLARVPPNGAVVMHLDVTAERQAVDELRRSERLKSAILESSLDCLLTIDHEGKIVEFNAAAEATFGLTREQALGRVMVELIVPPRLRDAHRRGFAHYLATGEGHALGKRLELNAIRADGTEFPIELTITAIETTSTPMFTGSIRDITASKEAAGKIKRLNRVYAVMSGINTLILRVRDREELFREACRIAVEHGNFGVAWVGMLNRATQDVTAVAWAGESAEVISRPQRSAREEAPLGKGVVGRAIRERRPAINNDLAGHSLGGLHVKEILRLGYQSLIALPLFEEQAVVGTLSMYAREPDFFDEEELRLLTALAGDISFALENISRQQKLEKLARMRAVSSEINAGIIRIHDREVLLRETCRIAVEHGKFELVWIAFIDQEKQHVQPVAWAGFSSEIACNYPWARLGTPGVTLAEVIQTRKAAARNDFASEMTAGGLREEAMRRGYRSTVCVPFVTDDSVVGAIILFAPDRGFFDPEEVALLNEVAGNISFALQHIEKEEKIARLNRIQAVTGCINALIVRVHERRELFVEACRIAVEEGKFPLAWIGVLDPATQDVNPVAWAGQCAEEITATSSSARDDTPRGRGAVGRAIRERRAVLNNDLRGQSLGGPRREVILRLGFQSLIALPLFEDQTVVATLTLYTGEPDFFDEEELRLLTELSGDISFALENISRQQKLAKLSRIRAVSSEINAAIVRIRERKTLLKEACRIVSEHGKFGMIWIGAIDHDMQQVQPVAWAGFSEETAHAVNWSSISATKGTIGEAIQTRKASVRNSVEGELQGGKLRQEAMKQGYRSSLCLPLIVDEKVTALVVLFATGRGFFDQEELILLNEVASDLSFALQAIEKQERLDYLAYYDVLTGLANRTLFIERVAQYMRSAVSGGHKLALYLIDLERFKNINDSLGQPAGDALLKQVARWMKRHVGDANLLARIGADHFAAVLPEVGQEGDAARRLEKLSAAFLNHPFRLNGAAFRIAAKVGIALFPSDGPDAETLFRNAEAALKKAKARGDRYLFYTPGMTELVASKLTLENQLRQALGNEEFVLHYQPKMSLASGKLTSAEALIRWNDPRTGLVPPGKFIPVLEETGLIYEVGRWALRKAIEDYLRWCSAGLPAVRIAVNVSPLQLRHHGFIAEIEQAVGIDARAAAGLELEITESLIMEDVKHSIASLQAIRALGVSVAIDDFGTGFSSLSYLSKLPVDTLKIDRSFVIDMTTGPQGLALVSTIIKLAHSLKLKVVAEGVETEEQSRLLRLLSCDEMQGFLFSKPLPGNIFEATYLARCPADALT